MERTKDETLALGLRLMRPGWSYQYMLPDVHVLRFNGIVALSSGDLFDLFDRFVCICELKSTNGHQEGLDMMERVAKV